MIIINEGKNDCQRGRNGRQRGWEQTLTRRLGWSSVATGTGRVVNDDEGEDKDRVIENSHYR